MGPSPIPPVPASADSGISRSVRWIKAQRESATHPESPSTGFALHSPLAPLSRGEQEGSGGGPNRQRPVPRGSRAGAWPGRASLTLAVGPGSRTSCAYPTERRLRGRAARGCTSWEGAAPGSLRPRLPACPAESRVAEGGCLGFPAPVLPQPYLAPRLQGPESQELKGSRDSISVPPAFDSWGAHSLWRPRWGAPAPD